VAPLIDLDISNTHSKSSKKEEVEFHQPSAAQCNPRCKKEGYKATDQNQAVKMPNANAYIN
jgi:hypothetical protein